MSSTRRRPLCHQCICLLLALLAACTGSGAVALKPPSPLVDCLKEGQRNQLTTYKDFVDGTPTRWVGGPMRSRGLRGPLSAASIPAVVFAAPAGPHHQSCACPAPALATTQLCIHVPAALLPGSRSRLAGGAPRRRWLT
jgi:hypothetical protein